MNPLGCRVDLGVPIVQYRWKERKGARRDSGLYSGLRCSMLDSHWPGISSKGTSKTHRKRLERNTAEYQMRPETERVPLWYSDWIELLLAMM